MAAVTTSESGTDPGCRCSSKHQAAKAHIAASPASTLGLATIHKRRSFHTESVFGGLFDHKLQGITGVENLRQRHLWFFSPEGNYDIGCEQNR